MHELLRQLPVCLPGIEGQHHILVLHMLASIDLQRMQPRQGARSLVSPGAVCVWRDRNRRLCQDELRRQMWLCRHLMSSCWPR